MKKLLLMAAALVIGFTASATDNNNAIVSEGEQSLIPITVEANIADRTSAYVTYHNGTSTVTERMEYLSKAISVKSGTSVTISFSAYDSNYSGRYYVEVWDIECVHPERPSSSYYTDGPVNGGAFSKTVNSCYHTFRVNMSRSY